MAFDANDLSPHEHFVVERARLGEVADFTPMGGADGSKPAIRAGFLRKLMLSLEPEWRLRAPGVRLRGARIEGALDLTDCSGAPPLSLDACDVPDVIDLSRATLGRLALTRCRLRELSLVGARISGDLDLTESAPLGAPGAEMLHVNARAATIDGALILSGAKCTRGEDTVTTLIIDNVAIGGDCVLDQGFEAFGGVSLVNARIGGALICTGASLLNRADDAKSAALNARGAQIARGIAFNEKFKAEGEIDLSGAGIGGDIDLSNADLRNEFGAALRLTNARVGGQIAGAAKISGQVQAQGAEITHNLDLRGAEIAHPLTPRRDSFGTAFDAASIAVGGAFLLQGANIKGEVFLADARISSYFALGGGRFINGGGWALRAPNVRVGGNLTLKIDETGFAPHGQKTVIEGGAKFDRARIEGALAWLNLELRGPGPDNARGGAFSFADANISGPLQARAFITHQDARIDASGAHCAGLDDDIKTGWGSETAALQLDGFRYERIDSADDTRRARLAWLKRANRESFTAQPYAQAARVYAGAGRREDARRVQLAQHDAQTTRAAANPISWLFSSLFGLIAGYGLAPVRVLRALALFLALGVFGVFAMNAQGALVTPQGRACNGAIEPTLYAVDVALPVVDLGQASRCAPGRTARAELPAGAALGESDWRVFEGVALWRWAHALYAMLGAILTALAVLTFSGVVKPKQN